MHCTQGPCSSHQRRSLGRGILFLKFFHVAYHKDVMGDWRPLLTMIGKGTADGIQYFEPNVSIFEPYWLRWRQIEFASISLRLAVDLCVVSLWLRRPLFRSLAKVKGTKHEKTVFESTPHSSTKLSGSFKMKYMNSTQNVPDLGWRSPSMKVVKSVL